MSSQPYTPGQFLEEIHVDVRTGVRRDSLGNEIRVEPQSFSGLAPAYYTEAGQALLYQDVYPGPVNVHQNVPLSNMAVAFEIDSGIFVGPEIAPVFDTKKRSDSFYKISRDDVTRDQEEDDVRAVGGVANEIQQSFDLDNFQVIDHALRDFLPDEVAENADEVLSLMDGIMKFITTVLEFNYDRRVFRNLFTVANLSDQTFASTNTAAEQIGDATPLKRHIHNAFNQANITIIRQNVIVGATHVVMSADVAQRIAASPELADQVKLQIGESYVKKGGWAGRNFGLPNELYDKTVVVVPHVNNTAAKGQTAVFSDLLTDNLIFLHVEPPSRRTRNTGTTFRKNGLNVRTYRNEDRKGTFIEVEMIQVEKLTNAFGGHILTDALA